MKLKKCYANFVLKVVEGNGFTHDFNFNFKSWRDTSH